MPEALINHFDHDEGRGYAPNEGSQRPPIASSGVHRELEKVKFLEFQGSMDGLVTKAWLENMKICLEFVIISPT